MEELIQYLPVIMLGVMMFGVFVFAIKAGRKEHERIIEQMKKDAAAPREKWCPPHPWTYEKIDGVERLWCPKCKMIPGADTYTPR